MRWVVLAAGVAAAVYLFGNGHELPAFVVASATGIYMGTTEK